MKLVRLNNKTPSPYLRKHWKQLLPAFCGPEDCRVVDLGCGNGRNSRFLKSKRFNYPLFVDFYSLDVDPKQYSEAQACRLGKDKLPVHTDRIQVFLANYLFMFLNGKGRRKLIWQIKRLAEEDSRIMVELYASKNSYATTPEDIANLQRELIAELNWNIIHEGAGRFIASKSIGQEGQRVIGQYPELAYK